VSVITKKAAHAVLARLTGAGADYAEVFAEEARSRSIRLIDKQIERASSGIDWGAGVRAIYGIRQVYAYSSDTSEKALMMAADAVAQAGKEAKEVPALKTKSSKLRSPHVFLVSSEDVEAKERIGILLGMDAAARAVSEQISQVDAAIQEGTADVAVANSAGVWAEEHRVYSRLYITSIAQKGAEKEWGFRGPGALAGFEFIRSLDTPGLARESAESALRAVNSGYAPAGEMPVVVGNGFGGVIFHEACGHALETTSVAKKASVFTDKIGQPIACPCLTAIDDGTMPGLWGSSVFDDEGTPTQRTVLIENGILKAFMVDRLGAIKTGYPLSGSGRRESYRYAPTSRMRNTYIEKGDAKVSDILASVDYGLYAQRMGGGSVDPSTGRFNFSVAEGFMIRGGKVAECVRGATLIGSGPEVLKRITRVADDLEHTAGVCGSISGGVPTTVGQPTILVDRLTVGGRSQ